LWRYNSSQPVHMNAWAFAQGGDIHVAPGQEQHVPHEAWHVVQQAQGRVKPTMQMHGGVAVNHDRALEREADAMGAQAARMPAKLGEPIRPGSEACQSRSVQGKGLVEAPVQFAFWSEGDDSAKAWHAEDVDAHWVDSGRQHDEDGHAGNVYFPALSLRGKVHGAAAVVQGQADHLLLACWNWALTGFVGDGVFPQHVFAYVRKRQEVLEHPEIVFDPVTWINAEVPVAQGRQWLLNNRLGLDGVMAQWMQGLVDGEMPDDLALVATTEITRQIITAHGFTIAPAATPYEICMHYKIADGITFDHWWINVDGKTAETFPGKRNDAGVITSGVLDIQILGAEQNHDGKNVIRFFVTALKPVQQQVMITAINAAVV
jgi:hypothetical protein